MRMNPPEYYGSNNNKDLVEFIDETYWIVVVMGVPPKEKVELMSNQLKGMDKVWND